MFGPTVDVRELEHKHNLRLDLDKITDPKQVNKINIELKFTSPTETARL